MRYIFPSFGACRFRSRCTQGRLTKFQTCSDFFATGKGRADSDIDGRNAEVYMLPAFTMRDMLDTAVKYQIKELLVVPPILIRLVRDPIVDQYDLSHLRRFLTGAAPISEEIIQLLQKKFPHTKFRQGAFSIKRPSLLYPSLDGNTKAMA